MPDGLDWLERLKDRLISIHLHDNDGTADQHNLPFWPGGTVDWDRLTKILATSGYTKWVSMESTMKRSNMTDETGVAGARLRGGNETGCDDRATPMTHKQRILAACSGQIPDRIPWIPRLDLWYNAHSRAGTLPHPFQKASLREITNALGVGYHAVVPNFLDIRSPDDTIDRTLGIYRLKTMPFETRLHNVRREVHIGRRQDPRHLPHASRQRLRHVQLHPRDERRRRLDLLDRRAPLQDAADVPALAHIFANLEVVRTYDSYRAWQEWVGEDGVAVAFASLSASPMHHIMRELMPMTDFFLELHDYPDELAGLAQSMDRWFREMIAALVESPAEVIFLGANYDETITYPPFFEQHILPWLAEAADLAHRHGKFLLTHTDGENQALLDLYRRCRFDIADSFCPRPDDEADAPAVHGALPSVTVWGGIPSVALCKSSMSDRGLRPGCWTKQLAFAQRPKSPDPRHRRHHPARRGLGAIPEDHAESKPLGICDSLRLPWLLHPVTFSAVAVAGVRSPGFSPAPVSLSPWL